MIELVVTWGPFLLPALLAAMIGFARMCDYWLTREDSKPRNGK